MVVKTLKCNFIMLNCFKLSRVTEEMLMIIDVQLNEQKSHWNYVF
jgi:hypothetical protein